MAKPKKGKNKATKVEPPKPEPKVEQIFETEKAKHKAKVETEDEEEVQPVIPGLLSPGLPAPEDLFHSPVLSNSAPEAWAIAPGDSVSNVNSNAGAWGGATAAPTPPPKRTSINANLDQFLMNDAAASALNARIRQIQQQEGMLRQHNHRDAHEHGKEQRGRQRTKHGREAAVDSANDVGWGTVAGGGWGATEQNTAWPQPSGNGDTWGMPTAIAPGGFGVGIGVAGMDHTPVQGSKRTGKRVHDSPVRFAEGGWEDEDEYADDRDTAVNNENWGINGGWGDTILQQRQGTQAATGRGGGWSTGGGLTNAAAAGGWGAAEAGQQPVDDWGMPKAHAPSVANTSSWGGWLPTPEHQQSANTGLPNGKIPKVTVQAPSSVDAKTIVSTKQHSGGLFSAIPHIFGIGRGKGQRGGDAGSTAGQAQKDKHGRKDKKRSGAAHRHSPWVHVGPDIEEEEEEEDFDEDEDEDEDEYYDDNAWPGQAQQAWPNSGLLRQSKAYTMASGHTPASRYRPEITKYEGPIMESYHIGLESAKKALYSKDRLARNRIHWLFDPRKDQRVASVLDFVEMWKHDIAKLGLQKFVEAKERGALFVNVDYHHPTAHYLPSFDFLTYNEIKDTFDRTLQESLAFYDPLSQVLVFVFLLSKSRNSMAIWRRKIPIPQDLKALYGATLVALTANLKHKYPIYLDEPIETEVEQKKKLTKRKWLRWGRS